MKIAFYTAIYGDYDILKPPINKESKNQIDYFIFKDNEVKIDGFKSLVLSKFTNKSNSWKARYAKLNAHKYLLEYDYLVWFDGSFQIDEKEILNLIRDNQNVDLFLFKHPTRNCAYKEIAACYLSFKESTIKLFLQNLLYRIRGFRKDSGLYATGIFIRKYSTQTNVFFEEWFKHVHYLSKRDQISLPFVLEKHKLKLLVLSKNIYDSSLGYFYKHSKSIYSTNKGFFRRAYFKVKLLLKGT
jgi:hypothetical protein